MCGGCVRVVDTQMLAHFLSVGVFGFFISFALNWHLLQIHCSLFDLDVVCFVCQTTIYFYIELSFFPYLTRHKIVGCFFSRFRPFWHPNVWVFLPLSKKHTQPMFTMDESFDRWRPITLTHIPN